MIKAIWCVLLVPVANGKNNSMNKDWLDILLLFAMLFGTFAIGLAVGTKIEHSRAQEMYQKIQQIQVETNKEYYL
jgi:hypothetical protein